MMRDAVIKSGPHLVVATSTGPLVVPLTGEARWDEMLTRWARRGGSVELHGSLANQLELDNDARIERESIEAEGR